MKPCTPLLRFLFPPLALGLFGAAAPAAAGVLDFEGLAAGGPVAPITVDGVTVTFSATGGIDEAWIYDSSPANTNPEDPDLLSPFFNAASRPGQFEPKDQGNVLIIQENSGPNPDDNAAGGTLVFDFDRAVTLLSLDVMDASLTRGQFTANLYGDSGLLLALANQFDGDTSSAPNYYETLSFGAAGVIGVSRLELELDGISGAVDNIVFTRVPDPAALPIFLAGLTCLGLRSRRRGAPAGR